MTVLVTSCVSFCFVGSSDLYYLKSELHTIETKEEQPSFARLFI